MVTTRPHLTPDTQDGPYLEIGSTNPFPHKFSGVSDNDLFEKYQLIMYNNNRNIIIKNMSTRLNVYHEYCIDESVI